MAAEKRKLMVEIDKCFKKIDEGIELFEDMMSKLNEANSDNQREKCQEDLKKEIKKLQRLRDQVKNWQTSSEIKEKEKLKLYRRLIEEKMELFKDIERENKTKPHSKIGLSIEEKVDPKDKEKTDVLDWLKAKIRAVQEEIDRTESKLELLTSQDATTDRKRQTKQEVKEQEEEEAQLTSLLERVKFHMSNLEVCMRLLLNEKLDSEDVKNKLMEAFDMYEEALDPDTELNPLDLEPDDIYQELGLHEYIDQFGTVCVALLDEEKLKTPEVEKSLPKEIVEKKAASKHASSVGASVASSTPKNILKAYSSSHQEVPNKIVNSAPHVHALSYSSVLKTGGSKENKENANATAPSSPVTTKPMSSFFKQRHEAKVEAEKTKSLKPKEEKKQEELNNNMIIVRDDVPELRTGQEKSEVDEEEDLEQEHSDYYSSIFLDDLNEEDGKIYEDFRQYISSSKLKESQFSFSGDTLTEPPKGPSSATIDPYAAYGISAHPNSEEQKKVLECLEFSAKNIPVPADHLRARSCLPIVYTKDCSPYWPKEVPQQSFTTEYYTKIPPETLFFLFYYMEGTYAQRLAANALKHLQWRFHKKFLTWFQRQYKPSFVTPEYERGDYLYFDFEQWKIVRREDFTFEYKYLDQRKPF